MKRKKGTQAIYALISCEKNEKGYSEEVFGTYSSVKIGFEKVLEYLKIHWTSAKLEVDTAPYMLTFDFDCEFVSKSRFNPGETKKKKLSYYMTIKYLDDIDGEECFFPEYEKPDYFIEENKKNWN